MYDPFSGRSLERFVSQAPSFQPISQPPSLHFEQRASIDSMMQTTSSTPRPFLTTHDNVFSSTLPAFNPFPPRGNPNDPPILEPRRHSNPSEDSDHQLTREYEYPLTHLPSSASFTAVEYDHDLNPRASLGSSTSRLQTRYHPSHPRRRPFNTDEFDGPSHLLPPPFPQAIHARSSDLPSLPISLSGSEQDAILSQMNNILCQCAFHFVAKYQFPIPVERDKPRIVGPGDREWTEWAYLLKRLATKRRIPSRVLYRGQIKHLVTTLENSLDVVRYTTRDGGGEGRELKDDRNVLQLISAGTQVAKILMDGLAMGLLDELYVGAEGMVVQRRKKGDVFLIDVGVHADVYPVRDSAITFLERRS